jgi:hypothetical protein
MRFILAADILRAPENKLYLLAESIKSHSSHYSYPACLAQLRTHVDFTRLYFVSLHVKHVNLPHP